MKITAQVRKKRRRRRDGAVSALLILLVICVCVIVVYCTDIFTVRSIVINADSERYQNADIINASGINEGDRLFLIRTGDAAEKLETALPYIQSAKIKRSIDGTLTMDLHICKAEYYISGTAGLVLLDTDGKVLENNVAIEPDDIAEIIGVTLITATPGYPVQVEQNVVLDSIRKLAYLFKENGINGVTMYDFSSDNIIETEIAHSVIVKINNMTALESKLKFLSEALSETMQSPSSGERIVFEMTANGSWSARGENSIEQAEREARERLNSNQPETDVQGNTIVSNRLTDEEPTTAKTEESRDAADKATEPSAESSTVSIAQTDTTKEQVFG